jgi:hypothetical protein
MLQTSDLSNNEVYPLANHKNTKHHKETADLE